MAKQQAATSVHALLDREVDVFDALMSEIAGGFRGPEHFDACEEMANQFCDRVRAAFRGRR